MLGFIIKTLKPYFCDTKISVDRERKVVTLERKGQKNELTYDQVIDQIEEVFGDGK